MLKIHSFLQRIKEPIRKIKFNYVGKYKTHIALIAYMMITVLFILSPDYIYDTGRNSNISYAKANTLSPKVLNVEEGTANEAIIRTDQKKQSNILILYDLTNKGSSLKLMEQNKISANSGQAGAAALEKVDSSSTDKNGSSSTKGAAKIKLIKTVKVKKITNKVKVQKEVKKKKIKKKKVVHLSNAEVKVLQRIVEAEATGEDVKGKVLVANVILNRVKSGSFPDSVKGVVFQKNGSVYQFSPIKDGRYWSVGISKATIKAVGLVLQGEDYSRGALYFSARSKADKNSMSWFDRNLDYLFKYGNHEFFK